MNSKDFALIAANCVLVNKVLYSISICSVIISTFLHLHYTKMVVVRPVRNSMEKFS